MTGSSASAGSPSAAVGPARSGWIVSPLFDLLFFANLPWVLALAPGFVLPEGEGHFGTHFDFWQIYFLTTPHRWITLALVAADPDRREGRTGWFVFLAIVAAVAVGGAQAAWDNFWCLFLVDYLWNYWHFGSQHGGILRIYGRKGGGGRPTLETWGVRLLVVYAALRITPWFAEEIVAWEWGRPDLLAPLDWCAVAIPAVLLLRELTDRPWSRPGKVCYLASVGGIYSGLILAAHFDRPLTVRGLATAAAAFHAIEYLAIVTHYAWRRAQSGSPGAFQSLARRWNPLLAVYVLGFGLLTAAIGVFSGPAGRATWAGIHLWASLLHFTYDGMIWKLRRPETARILGATATG